MMTTVLSWALAAVTGRARPRAAMLAKAITIKRMSISIEK